jgi:hypothetical protein
MQMVLRTLGWGVAMYAVMYLLWSGLVIYGLAFGYFSLAIRIAALVFLTTLAARALRKTSRVDVAPYSIAWALTAIALDAVFLVPYAGMALFSQWGVWVGYALIVTVPLLTFWSSKALPRPSRSEAAYRPRV